MPVVIALGVPLIVIAARFLVIALVATEPLWLRSLLNALSHPSGGFFKRTVFKALGLVVKGVLYVERIVLGAVSGAAAAGLGLVTRWLNGLSTLALHTFKELGEIAWDTANSLSVLRHQTMPKYVGAKVAPVRAQAAGAAVLGRRSISLGRKNERDFTRGIDRLKKLVLPLALGFAGIDAFVKGRHAARHHADHTHTIPHIRDVDIPRARAKDRAHDKTLTEHGTRLKRLERALGLGILAGLVVRTLAKVAPWLFCRNWKKIGRAVCGLSPGRVDALLALMLGVLAIRDIRTLARFAEAVEEDAARGIAALVGLTTHSGGRFTID